MIRKSVLLGMGLLMSLMVHADPTDLWVIVNDKNPVSNMEQSEVSDLYLGRYQAFPNGVFAIPLDHLSDSLIRKVFYQRLTDKPISFINAYWARVLFTEQSTPPRQVSSDATVIDLVRKNQSVMGYITARDTVPSGVKLVLVLGQTN
jgi:hypothetical protein